MKFTCQQNDLSKALNTVSKAISNRTTLPILKGILLEVSDSTLYLTASDKDLTIKKSIEVESYTPGSTVVSARLFIDIIKKLPGGEVEIEYNNGQVIVKCQSSLFNIVGQSPEEFPAIGDYEKENPIKLDKNILKEMIKKTSFAASIEEAKGIIVGVLIEMSESRMSMVALDGFRMAVSRENVNNKDNLKLIVAARILNEVNKIFLEDDSDNSVDIILGDKNAVFLIGGTTIIMRIMEGEFIKYKDILPKDSLSSLKINRTEMIDCLDRVSLLAKEGRNNLVRLTIEESKITVTSQSEEGNVKEELFIEKEGSNLDIGFNVKYLLEVFKVIDHEEVIMEFNTSISPCIIKPLEGDEFEYLILPVRIAARTF